jgi:SAM-dependent methyltransferase
MIVLHPRTLDNPKMNRVLEPEFMDDPDQAQAYAQTDFSEENQYFIDEFCRRFPKFLSGHVVDLGCGPADIPIRLVRALPACTVVGIDASLPMIQLGEKAVAAAQLRDRVRLCCEPIQRVCLPEPTDAAISNSLLHHLSDSMDFWAAITRLAKPAAPVLIMDLLRPQSMSAAQSIVDQYSPNSSEILRRDFYNSLLAAFTLEEISAQLAESGLGHFVVTQPDDRHWIANGHLVA